MMSRRIVLMVLASVCLVAKASETNDSVARILEGCLTSFSSQVERPITQASMFEAGGKSALDTYLSPLRYHGFYTSLSGRWSKALPWMDNSWLMRFDSRIGLDRKSVV